MSSHKNQYLSLISNIRLNNKSILLPGSRHCFKSILTGRKYFDKNHSKATKPINGRKQYKMLGIISGTIILHAKSTFQDFEEKIVKNEFGKALVLLSDAIAFIPRHGKDPENYILPHLINHQANLKALKSMGVKEVIGINSTGSLKIRLEPGMLVIPDDYIIPSGGPTIYSNKAVHITPTINEEIRRKLIEAARDCGIKVIDGGIYWQTTGPRLETKAEISMMAQFADLVGMTMASEAIIAKEMDLPYVSLCSVDNYGHGLQKKKPTMEQISQQAHNSTEAIIQIVNRYIERMGK
jgi:5'-methylthioadenosine phosphorylase